MLIICCMWSINLQLITIICGLYIIVNKIIEVILLDTYAKVQNLRALIILFKLYITLVKDRITINLNDNLMLHLKKGIRCKIYGRCENMITFVNYIKLFSIYKSKLTINVFFTDLIY